MPKPTLATLLVPLVLVITAPRMADADCWHDITLNGQNFATPKEACDAAVAQHFVNDVGAKGKVTATSDPTIFRCDEDYNGHVYGWGLVDSTPAQPHCYEAMSGPYSGADIGGAAVYPGFDYSDTQRSKIKDANETKCRRNLGSDLSSPYVQKILKSWIGETEPCAFLNHVNDPLHPECNPEVHHVIPKRDANGCGCGANSGSNALVVSKFINQKMSNKPPPQPLIDFINSMPANRCEALIH